MRPAARTWAAAIVIVVTTLPVTGCGKGSATDSDRLLAIVRATSLQSRTFDYVEHSSNSATSVTAAIDDDYRYRAQLAVNGDPVYQEVADDDALAARVLSPVAFAVLGRSDQAAVAPALKAGRWLIDEGGAPSVSAVATTSERAPGQDPILDALTVLDSVTGAIKQGGSVSLFNSSSLSYRPQDDPFPRPDQQSGESRYDVHPVALPRFVETGGGARTLPTVPMFRSVAVYVRKGLITRILEQITISPKQAASVNEKFALHLSAAGSTTALAAADMVALDRLLAQSGAPAVGFGTLTVTFDSVGGPVDVALPRGAVPGSLRVFRDRGQAPAPTVTATATASGQSP